MSMRMSANEPSVVQHIAKEFSRFLNRVGSAGNDFLGAFLMENEWQRHEQDAKEVLQALDLGGFVICPRNPTDRMVQSADRAIAGNKSLIGPKGLKVYVETVFGAMVTAWQQSRDMQLMADIVSMALARASSPSSRREAGAGDSNYRRFQKNALDIVAGIEKAGWVILPDEATPKMISAGVLETAEVARGGERLAGPGGGRITGADPTYVKSIYQNVIDARPDECRPGKK